MTITVPIRALGVDLDLDVSDDRGLPALVEAAWESCRRDVGSGPGMRIRVGSSEMPDGGEAAAFVVGDSVEEILERLSQRVTLSAIRERQGELLMLHACGLADLETGAVVALVGPSGTGKTTLSRRWGTRWGYVTDETVGIDASLRVTTYPKPLSIRGPETFKEQVAPAAAGLLGIDRPDLHLAGVVLLDRHEADEADFAGFEVDVLPDVEAIGYLVPHTSFLTSLDRPLARLAAAAATGGGVRLVSYQDNEDLGSVVAALLEGGR